MPLQTVSYVLHPLRWRHNWRLIVLSVVAEVGLVELATHLPKVLVGVATVLSLMLPLFLCLSEAPSVGVITALAGAIAFLPILSSPTDVWNYAVVVVSWVIATIALASITRRRRVEHSELAGRLLAAEGEERRRIASDLHDDTIQVMAGALLKLDGVERVMQETCADVQALENFESAVATLREALNRTRRMMFQLRPAQADNLDAALAHACRDLEQETGTVCMSNVTACETLPADTVDITYRVTLEALTNIRKHAQATRAVVRIERRDGFVHGYVRDDGVGFNNVHTRTRDDRYLHLGMDFCTERLRLAGGHYMVKSGVGKGTVVRFDVPIREEPGVIRTNA